MDGKPAIVEYEPDSDLRDTEQVPLLEEGGIEAFIRREVLPYTPDAWIKEDAPRSATRSASRGTSTSRSRCARWRDQRRHPRHREGGRGAAGWPARGEGNVIADLRPYPTYRDSGLPWLREVPSHWDTRRAKFNFFREVDERSETGKRSPSVRIPHHGRDAAQREDDHDVPRQVERWIQSLSTGRRCYQYPVGVDGSSGRQQACWYRQSGLRCVPPVAREPAASSVCGSPAPHASVCSGVFSPLHGSQKLADAPLSR